MYCVLFMCANSHISVNIPHISDRSNQCVVKTAVHLIHLNIFLALLLD